MSKEAVERCGCGKVWRGPYRTNPSLGCDICYRPGYRAELNKFHPPIAGCETCERAGECICWEFDYDRKILGEIGNDHEPFSY